MRSLGAGLYLHVPFCSKICPYCDFAVTTGGRQRRAEFVESLIAEAELWTGEPFSFDTLYFGGGTPSALEPDHLARIVDSLRSSLDIDPEAWIFLEANPEDVTPASLADWRSLGVRTLSLGIQSFDVGRLAFLGRRHSPEEARRSVLLAREAGFHTVSVDLIYGLPDQDVVAWQRDLQAAVALGPDHLSCYQLTIHEGTPFGRRAERGQLAELPEPAQADLFLLTHTFLADAGWPGYEVSNFARTPEHRSRHNRKYWDHTPYLGLGPSAHSFSGARDNRRWWNERALGPWQAQVARGERPIAGSEELAAEQLALEELMLGFRTYAGVDFGRVRERYGIDLLAKNAAFVAQLAALGRITVEGSRIVPTLAGLAVADSLARGFEIEG
ncbi:MAG TPA: radical SAM family heme chaperone HemW [Thermoanaerobaculia bacterium]|nr:radical SAM family heme chaperone HemW [Thermoanaerobaculia bacterium]